MAYGDLSFFLPQQQYYRNPGDYTSAMKNAALQKANYLAQLDVEMAQLDEAKRQYDKSLLENSRQFNKSLLENSRQFNTSLQEQKRSTNIQGYLENKQIGVAQDNADTNRIANYGQIALGAGKLGWDIFNEYGGRSWAEEMANKAGWFGTNAPEAPATEDQFSSKIFDLDSYGDKLDTSIWDNAWEADPLLDYELSW